MTKTEQIRLMTAMICGQNIFVASRQNDYVKKAIKIAEIIYKSVEAPSILDDELFKKEMEW